MTKLQSVDAFYNLYDELAVKIFPLNQKKLKVCCGTACTAMGSKEVSEAIRNEASAKKIDLQIVHTGCQGMCQKGPVMNVEPHGFFYQMVKTSHAPGIIASTFMTGQPYRQILYRNTLNDEPCYTMLDLPFYKNQLRIALRHNDKIDPNYIEQYIAVGGYKAFVKALSSMSPDDVINEIDKAHLRGRGGAGFPAGTKWRHTKNSKNKIKFVIANGDEGDPGAFMDRSIMEGNPHSLIEGMLINAYAIGAEFGFIYVRHEYPLAVQNLQQAINQAKELGLLGKNILGSGFNFFLDIREGAGAFVCGESTALVASIEGERGFPRPRPPRLSEVGGGVFGYPSNLNNIETFACVPPIIEKGADWFRSIGTESSPGTKVFALTGKVKNTGLVEVPMGTTLRDIVFNIGGGIIGDKKLKAVQTGGPSGGCLPANMIDMPVDFDSLTRVGSMMGSGGMVVMDEDTCMVDVAKYFLSFTQSESCGKCPPCRIGTYQMLEIMQNITEGKGRIGDIERLVYLGKMIQKGSLCGLGTSAPNPVLSTIKYFIHEFEEHIYDNYCRANVCKGLGVFVINHVDCILCGLCKEVCAYDAVKENRNSYHIDRTYCVKCKACYDVCPTGAVLIKKQSIVKLEEQFAVSPDKLEILERRAKMTLKDLLNSKPSSIITCSTECILADAVRLMDGKNVGFILVFDENKKLAGIFTERDIMHCFTKNVNFKEEKMKNVMTPNPLSLDASTDIAIAMSLMSERKIRHLPVTENEEIIGMVSYRDLVSYLLPEVTNMADETY